MKKLLDGNTFDDNIQTYYIEDSSELSSIPADAPSGTIVVQNKSGAFKIYMKTDAGTFNEI